MIRDVLPTPDRDGPGEPVAGTGQDGPHTVTRLLGELQAGDRRAFDDLLPLVYHELRELARRQRRRCACARNPD